MSDSQRLEVLFQNMLDHCAEKRSQLRRLGSQRQYWMKVVQVASGVLAALSGTSMIAVITKYTDSQTVQIISALLAFGSSILTLAGSAFLDKREINFIFEGSGKFQALRDRIEIEWSKPNRTSLQAYETARRFAVEYGALSHPYERLLPDTWVAKDTNVKPVAPPPETTEIVPQAAAFLSLKPESGLGKAADWLKSDTLREAAAVRSVAAKAAGWAKTDGAGHARKAAAWAKSDGVDHARAAAAATAGQAAKASRWAGTKVSALRSRKPLPTAPDEPPAAPNEGL